uniref:Chitinase domain-containing protein 1 n=1 Tax=Romanomermis culicivorax TaxID=13658 RepID=A0A915JLI0_ROMCU
MGRQNFGTLSKSDRAKKEKSLKKKAVRVEDVTFSEHVNYKDILADNSKLLLRKERAFSNPVLAYVTPWNNHGYTVAKVAAHKFTHISPVWFQVNSDRQQGCQLAGLHDLDQNWIENVRKNNSDIKIVPRFLFDKWTPDELTSFLIDQNEQNRCLKIFIDYVKRNRFDGVVLELWSKVFTTSYSADIKRILTDAVVNIGEYFQNEKLQFILVVPPLHPNADSQMFAAEDFEILLPFVDYFSVMTYDFPSKAPSGIAPIGWINECIESLLSIHKANANGKIFIGLNFYGYEYTKSGVTAITGNSYLDRLTKQKPNIQWHEGIGEHFIQEKNRVLFYPTLYSIAIRLNLARNLGVGVAIWEIGQGLDYFYDLF